MVSLLTKYGIAGTDQSMDQVVVFGYGTQRREITRLLVGFLGAANVVRNPSGRCYHELKVKGRARRCVDIKSANSATPPGVPGRYALGEPVNGKPSRERVMDWTQPLVVLVMASLLEEP